MCVHALESVHTHKCVRVSIHVFIFVCVDVRSISSVCTRVYMNVC